jgi:hypothetical protein
MGRVPTSGSIQPMNLTLANRGRIWSFEKYSVKPSKKTRTYSE